MKAVKNPRKVFEAVPQEHPMGCAVACVASLCGLPYLEALALFAEESLAWTRGYYCVEVVAALESAGLEYSFEKFHASEHQRFLEEKGTIVFVAPSKEYPAGHYLLRTGKGWMNPWSSFPHMAPVKAAVSKSLPGKAAYVIFPKE